jgi:hypothetical protein
VLISGDKMLPLHESYGVRDDITTVIQQCGQPQTALRALVSVGVPVGMAVAAAVGLAAGQ